ncbi:membrane protein insertion efficiency factor YidD [Patescibacteria group bacterium]|nr:membrane protein insertion efficiency factor YidD [Patescibacteria group bacterium]
MKKLLIFILDQYKRFVSPVLYQLIGSGCRYNPTCSEYALESVKRYGVRKGVLLAGKRVARCHPFSKHPYLDPLPIPKSELRR